MALSREQEVQIFQETAAQYIANGGNITLQDGSETPQQLAERFNDVEPFEFITVEEATEIIKKELKSA